MDSEKLAFYIEQTNGIAKPWLLIQLRLKKLTENRENLTSAEYEQNLADIYQDMMNLGEWWQGIEEEVF